MELKTFRAESMREALSLVRRELGPDAAVLETRSVSGGMLRWLRGSRMIEVTASANVVVPSRLPARATVEFIPAKTDAIAGIGLDVGSEDDLPADLRSQLRDLKTMVEDLCQRKSTGTPDIPGTLFGLFTELIEAEMPEELARELIDQVWKATPETERANVATAKARLMALLESQIQVAGPIQPTVGKRHLVALVGPTGVGKTTTIAKLAAHYRLRNRLRVGLITVDTYRIAAVEQLRTYADIIDLPMEVVSTPREMREAITRLADLDLVLMDTAGRSPRDEVRIQELKSMLGEAQPDEVHLVLSCVAGAAGLARSAERFASVGTTALILTKLDEASGLGNLFPLLRTSQLPLSYLTNGQNVPDDIQAADAPRLAKSVLGLEVAL